MLTASLKELAGKLDTQFALNTFFPVLVFIGAVTCITTAGVGDLSDLSAWWDEASGSEQAVIAVSATAATYFLANVVALSSRSLIRLYEGYGWPVRLRHWGCQRHRRRLAAMAAFSTPRYLHYSTWDDPAAGKGAEGWAEERLLPTRVGNALRAGEDYGYTQYRLATVLLWPRLFPLLPETDRTQLGTARSALDFSVIVSFLGVVTAVYTLAVGATVSLSWLALGLGALGGLAAFGIGYLAAANAAIAYSELIRATLDLHRFRLLENLHLPVPATPEDERRTWERLHRAILGAGTVTLPYVRKVSGG